MNTMMKSAIAAVIAASAVPLTASADTNVFRGKGAYAYIEGNGPTSVNGSPTYSSISIQADQNVCGSKCPGAYVNEYVYGDNICLQGYGASENIQFKATANRKTVSASGTVPVTQFYDCYTYEQVDFVDNVSFTMDISSVANESSSSSGTDHYKYGNTYRVNTHYDNTYYWSASANASTIMSDFGAITPYWAQAGQTKDHTVEIIK